MLEFRCLKYLQEITKTFPRPPLILLDFESIHKSFQARMKEKFYASTTPCFHR